MSDNYRDDSPDFGRFGPTRPRKLTVAEIGALVFAIVWVIVCVIFFFGLGGTEAGTEKNGVGFVLVVSSVLVPIAVVWLAVASARSARIVTDESERLQASMSAMRKVLVEVQEFQALRPPRPAEQTARLETPPKEQLTAEEAPAMFASTRPHSEAVLPKEPPAPNAKAAPAMRDVSPEAKTPADPKPQAQTKAEPEIKRPEVKGEAGDAQPSLELGSPQDNATTVDLDDLIRAINFPENAEDEEGFEALRRALVDRKVATLIQAAQDVLTLLSQDGIYMDDLQPDPARPDVWRRFAGGQRGSIVTAMGGIRDRSSLALSSGRMKSDASFRDAALHFLRKFDEVLTDAEPRMNDEQLSRFATTRTARAFMLMGRVTGAFD